MICPKCEGRKGGIAFVCGGVKSGPQWMPCFTCKGAGEITEAQNELLLLGEAIRKDRMVRDRTAREESTRLKIAFLEYNDIEHGREPRTQAGRDAFELRRKELGL